MIAVFPITSSGSASQTIANLAAGAILSHMDRVMNISYLALAAFAVLGADFVKFPAMLPICVVLGTVAVIELSRNAKWYLTRPDRKSAAIAERRLQKLQSVRENLGHGDRVTRYLQDQAALGYQPTNQEQELIQEWPARSSAARTQLYRQEFKVRQWKRRQCTPPTPLWAKALLWISRSIDQALYRS